VFESSTFIFLVFELCKNGELFDYLTSVVALSEKKTRQVIFSCALCYLFFPSVQCIVIKQNESSNLNKLYHITVRMALNLYFLHLLHSVYNSYAFVFVLG
jgi:hypothetical protein